MKRKFYVDTCIYLNLWKKEKLFWEKALSFFEKREEHDEKISYSKLIIKELKYILSEKEFEHKRNLFRENRFEEIKLITEDIINARKIETEIKYELSFYDILHMLLARKSQSILITRDRKLIKIARKYNIKTKRPEEIL